MLSIIQNYQDFNCHYGVGGRPEPNYLFSYLSHSPRLMEGKDIEYAKIPFQIEII